MQDNVFKQMTEEELRSLLDHIYDYPSEFQLIVQNTVARNINQYFSGEITIHNDIWKEVLRGYAIRIVNSDVMARIGDEMFQMNRMFDTQVFMRPHRPLLRMPTYDKTSFRNFLIKLHTIGSSGRTDIESVCSLFVKSLIPFKLRGMSIYNNVVYCRGMGLNSIGFGSDYFESLWKIIELPVVIGSAATKDDIDNAALFTHIFANAFDVNTDVIMSVVSCALLCIDEHAADDYILAVRDLDKHPMSDNDFFERFRPTKNNERLDFNFGNTDFSLFKVKPSINADMSSELLYNACVFGANISAEHYMSTTDFVNAVLRAEDSIKDQPPKLFVGDDPPVLPIEVHLTPDLDQSTINILYDTDGIENCSITTPDNERVVFKYNGVLYLALQKEGESDGCVYGMTVSPYDGKRNLLCFYGDKDIAYKLNRFTAGGDD